MLIINQAEGWFDVCEADQKPSEDVVKGRPPRHGEHCGATWGGGHMFLKEFWIH